MATLNREIDWTTTPATRIIVEYEALLTHDPNYGADADGNRGMPFTFIDSIEFSEVEFQMPDGTKKVVKVEELLDAENELICEMIEEELANADASSGWDPRDEPEYLD